MKLDILAVVSHPDDVEISFGGTLIVHKELGYKTGIIDMTRGELGTRGTPVIRAEEAEKATIALGVSIRENLGLPDGFFENNKKNQLRLVEQIRRFRPRIVITNSIYDRHPDHTRASQLVEIAFFLAGLEKVKTVWERKEQKAYRPEKLYFSIQSTAHTPDLLVDISDAIEKKRDAINAYQSQFYNPDSMEPETYISSREFMSMLDSRARELGQRIGVAYAEGFKVKHSIGVKHLFDLL